MPACSTEPDRRQRIRMATIKVATGWGIVLPFSVVLLIMLVTRSAPAGGLGVEEAGAMLLGAALGIYLMTTGLTERKRLGASGREL